MSEFNFSCPNCQQLIAATPDLSGMEVACPTCQTVLIVPAAPGAPAPQSSSKLHVAPTEHGGQAAPFVPQGPPVRKKKSRKKLYINLGITAGVVVAGAIFGPMAYDKYHAHQEEVAAQQAATNAPAEPPPPPVLTVEEILKNVTDVYGGMPSYAAEGQSQAAIDISQLNPAMKGTQNYKAKVSMALAHPNLYRVEWQRDYNGRTIAGAAWSAGKGDYLAGGLSPAGKSKSRQVGLTTLAQSSLTLCDYIPQIFFNDTNSLARQSDSFAKTNGTAVNGEDCYILAGQFKAHDILLWVDKKTFLIPQIQFVYGRKVEDADLKDLPRAEKTLLTTWSKIQGSVTETYNNIATNKTLTAAIFSSPLMPLQGQPGQGQTVRREPPHGNPYSATDLTRRVRQANANEQRNLQQQR